MIGDIDGKSDGCQVLIEVLVGEALVLHASNASDGFRLL